MYPTKYDRWPGLVWGAPGKTRELPHKATPHEARWKILKYLKRSRKSAGWVEIADATGLRCVDVIKTLELLVALRRVVLVPRWKGNMPLADQYLYKGW